MRSRERKSPKANRLYNTCMQMQQGTQSAAAAADADMTHYIYYIYNRVHSSAQGKA